MSTLTSVLRFLSRHPAVRVGKAEARLWRGFWYLIRGRLIVPDGATPMPATTGVWFLPGAISVATVIEITAVELLVPWKELRIILAIASVYSLMILWAMLGRQKTYPHYLDRDSLVLRRGGRVLAELPWSMIRDCARDRRYDTDQATVDDGVLTLGTGEGTNIRITLNAGLSVADPDRWPWQRPQPVEISEIRLWLDEPAEAPAALTASAQLHRVHDHHVAVRLAGNVRRHRAEQSSGQ